ncbi:lipase family alpha/beta hydrolase [Allopontixanthobacter sediminis]|uniref:Alpha/beta hydrolase n=1 Tax=Allopontixanthobacter sediminis TaxID=1689985 RepID=A0A845B4V7_9SPHN|nr:alpha/beta hydrolase [Allopontixanthobacter sediminis]MXP45410.1 alpha/beta hydrolase [Allopontixanthobacter sediminis]
MTQAGTSDTARTARPPSRLLTIAEPSRALVELASFFALRPAMSLLPRGDGHGVLVLPGFMASDGSTKPMRSLLTSLNYDVQGWDLGRNVRVDNDRVDAMKVCVEALYERSGGKISIIGWSLGGVFARELAKMMPEKVRLVISLGSPISDDRGHTNAARLFEWLNGKTPEPVQRGMFTGLHEAPPVPTTSILTKTDGVVGWRGSVQTRTDEAAQTENIEVHASHCGLGVNPAVMLAIADRLAQPEGAWQPFEAKGLARAVFPRSKLH